MSEKTDNNQINNDIPPQVDVINNQYTGGNEVNASNGMFMLLTSLALLVKEVKQQLAKDLTLVLFGKSSVDPVIKVN